MWKREKEELLDTVKIMEEMENRLTDLEDQYGEDLEFEEECNINLIELSNNIFRLRELINQYIKEEDKYYTKEE